MPKASFASNEETLKTSSDGVETRSPRNALLDKLPHDEAALVERIARRVAVKENERLVEKDKPIPFIYFLESGWASVTAMGSVRPVEVAMVGPEGFIGISVFLGSVLAANNCTMQSNGAGLQIMSTAFLELLGRVPTLRRRIKHYTHKRLLEAYESIVASTVGSLEARVSRAILMCQDRAGRSDIPITQDELARKVGANRAGVTTALHILEGHNIIQSKRRCVLILDRLRLESAAAGTYARTQPARSEPDQDHTSFQGIKR